MTSLPGNQEAIEAWNTVLFEKFVRFRPIVTTALGHHGTRAMARLAPSPGASVVDIGCGFGDTTQDLGKLVGPTGRAVGVDAAESFIAAARHEATGVTNVSFEVADVEAGVPGGPYDCAFSRMGTMFFNQPVIVRELLGDPPKKDQVTCGPGPFSMASPDLVSDQLLGAGYTDIAFERSDADMRIGTTIADAMEFALTLGPAGEVVRLAGDAAVQRRAEIEAALRKAIEPFVRDGGVYAPSSTWLVSARVPS